MCLCVSVEREGASQKQSHKPIYLLNKVNAALKVTKMLLIFAIVTFTNYYWSQNSFVFTVWVSKFCNKGVGVCDIHWLELKGDDLFKSHNGCSCHQHHSLQLLKSRWQIVTTIIDNLKFAYLEMQTAALVYLYLTCPKSSSSLLGKKPSYSIFSALLSLL